MASVFSSTKVKNKQRLYIALYPAGGATFSDSGERRFHWSFLVGPKFENQDHVPGKRYHVKNISVPDPAIKDRWEYEEVDLPDVRTTGHLMIRILIGKILDEARFVAILRSVPVVQHNHNWTCLTWVMQSLSALERDNQAMGTAILDGPRIESIAKQYAANKIAANRFETSSNSLDPKPAYDLLNNKEMIP